MNKYAITCLNASFCNSDAKDYMVSGYYKDQKLIDVIVTPKEQASIVLGGIYVARVQNVVPNINAAFVELNKGCMAYLSFEELKNPIFTKRISTNKPIVQGDELLVQVIKEAVKTKDAVVSTNLSLSGKYSVVTSGNTSLGISSKLSKLEKEELKQLLTPYKEAHESIGIIARTNSFDATKEELLNEIDALRMELEEIIQTAPSRVMYSCMYQPKSDYLQEILRYRNELDEVYTDIPEVYEELNGYFETNEPDLFAKLRFYNDSQLELNKLLSVEKQLTKAMERYVWLKSGANIVIESTEALTVIDINTGKNIKKKDKRQQILDVNKEACEEIANQLRLRNISGIIIIDFIEMKDPLDKEEIIQYMKQCFKSDPVKVDVIDFTRLGLMEVTRKKVRKSLKEQIEC